MFKRSKKAEKLLDKIWKEGLLSEESVSNWDRDAEQFEKISYAICGNWMCDSSDPWCDWIDMCEGQNSITVAYNGDSQFYVYFATETQVLKKMKMWQKKLKKLCG